jgi:hypothetical protein
MTFASASNPLSKQPEIYDQVSLSTAPRKMVTH